MGVSINKITLVVFSAGSGRRLLPYTYDTPKIFVGVGPNKIFDYVARPILHSHICKNSFFVIKKKRRKYKFLKASFRNLKLIQNSFHDSCHCSSSIAAALPKLDGDILFLNSDLVLDKKNVHRIIRYASISKSSVVFGLDRHDLPDDCDLQRVDVGEEDSITHWSMTLKQYSHYICGPVLIKAVDLKKIKTRVSNIGIPELITKPCFTFFSEMLGDVDFKLYTVNAGGFSEIDTPGDLGSISLKRWIG